MIPVALAGAGVLAVWALAGLRSMDLSAAARDTVFCELGDGLFVLDAQQRIVDLNRTGGRILGRSAADAAGHPATELFAGRLQPLLDAVLAPGSLTELALPVEGESRVFTVRIVPVNEPARPSSGQILVLRDITAFRDAQTLLHATFLAEASAALASSLD